MPLFRRRREPGLDELTSDEERKREAVNQEVMRAWESSPDRALEEMNLQVLEQKVIADKKEFLWPHLHGSQLLQMGEFERALSALGEAKSRKPEDARGPYGVATVYYTAATKARQPAGRWPQGKVYLDMGVGELYENALREFRESLQLSQSRRDRQLIQSSIEAIELAFRRRVEHGG